MKLTVIALALAATTFAANAQTTIITEERAPSAVIVTEPSASTTVHTKERGGLLGTETKSTTTTTGSGAMGDCSSRTVHKEGLLTGEKTVSKTTCD